MKDTARPRGRDPVRAALIEAAATLFAERGPAMVSVRDVAREADVNHGLVHRHFGSKDGLLKEVMNHLSAEVAEAIGEEEEGENLLGLLARTLGATQSRGRHWKILAHSLLEGADPQHLQAEFPVVQRMVAAARRGGGGSISPEALVTLLVCTALGMMMFKPYLQVATGQTDGQWDQTRNEISGLMAQLAASMEAAGD